MYNKSEIFKNAWAMVKEAGMTISAALKKAWAMAKGTFTKMTGSEKQIKWATEIKNRIVKIYDEVLSQNENHPNYAQVKAISEKLIANIESAYAGDVIDAFKNVQDVPGLSAAVKMERMCGKNWIA